MKNVYPDAEICIRPLADGGEGTVEALTLGMGGTICNVRVTGLLGEPVDCQYGMIEETKTAVMEMAAAAGISLVKEAEKSPLTATTYGGGEMIRDAIEKGCRRFIVGIDGSATNDGGLGFAFLTFTNAVLESGVKLVLEETKLREYIKDADFVITGEGRLDGQTVMGKAPIGVAKLAKEYGKKVVAFSGCVTRDACACNDAGIDAFFPILRTVVPLEEAMRTETAGRNMTETVEQVFRLIRAAGDR